MKKDFKKAYNVPKNINQVLGEFFPKGFFLVSIDENGDMRFSANFDSNASSFAVLKNVELILESFYSQIDDNKNQK